MEYANVLNVEEQRKTFCSLLEEVNKKQMNHDIVVFSTENVAKLIFLLKQCSKRV